MGVWRDSGCDVLRALGGGLDDLHAAVGAPVTARRTWMQAWIDSYPDYEPVAVAVGDHFRRKWDAVALLAVRRGRLLDRVVSCGHGPSDAVLFAARDESSAEQLAAVLAGDLAARPRAWGMALRHVLPHDLVVPRLSDRLTSSQQVRGDVSPVLRVAPGTTLRDYVSNSHRKRISQIRKRMAREGLEPTLTHVRDRGEVEALLPEMERVHRARDEELRGVSRLDDAAHRRFLRRVVLDHAELDQLELIVLRLQGRLAAYTLSFLDEGVHRMWNTRFDPQWARFSPGKLAVEAAVEHAIDAGCDHDFMRGEEQYKASYANDQVVAQELYASSGAATGAGIDAYLRTRQRLREAHERGDRAARLVEIARRVRTRWDLR